METQRTLSKATVIEIIRRAGYTPEVVDEIASRLQDPVDLDRDASLLAHYGVTRTALTDRLGGSP
ncbi:MAG TPA: hypothetical protein VG476_11930 [Acidimicrobiales bacterium]|nr:hypothetical protein [Acidimicrobiales bacterium]